MRKILPLFGVAVVACFTLPVLHAQPPGYPAGGPYHRPPMERTHGFNVQRSVRFRKDQDEHGYHLRIHTRGYTPEAIQVKVEGPFLLVENQEAHRTENRHERGYSFSSSSSSMRRRFRLPRNADAAAMQRTEQDGVVVITLPYR